ncbi:MAG: TetR/AcrR family transcriptional regulator [Syntrophomonadaceae bacterium]
MSMREKEKDFKKQLIADAAYSLLSKIPYESVTVDDVAKAAGCGKGTIYQYFENKDHVLAYLVYIDLKKLCGEIEAQCVKNPDLQEAIFNYMLLHYNYYLKSSQIFSSWLRRSLEENMESEWAQAIKEIQEQKLQMMVRVLERGIKEQSLIEVDPYHLARLLENIFRDITFSLPDKNGHDEELGKMLDLVKMVISSGIFINKALQKA